MTAVRWLSRLFAAVAVAAGLLAGWTLRRVARPGGEGAAPLPPVPAPDPAALALPEEDRGTWGQIVRAWGPAERTAPAVVSRAPLELVSIHGAEDLGYTAWFSLSGKGLSARAGEGLRDAGGEADPRVDGWTVSEIRIDRVEVELVKDQERWVLRMTGAAVSGPAAGTPEGPGPAAVTVTRARLRELMNVSRLYELAAPQKVRWDTVEAPDGGVGIRVLWIAPDSELGTYGLRAGDVVLGVGTGDRITRFRQNVYVEAASVLRDLEGEFDSLQEVAVDVLRENRPQRLRVRVAP